MVLEAVCVRIWLIIEHVLVYIICTVDLHLHPVLAISDDILYKTREVFEDVVDDFSEMDSVRQRFCAWKGKYRETYKEAYIALCLPKLVNPFIRLQLISWNPLQVSYIGS